MQNAVNSVKTMQRYDFFKKKLRKSVEVKKFCLPLQSQTTRKPFETTNSRIAQLVRASDC